MTDVIHPVILCGGFGTRLWPLSRRSYPKQFVNFIGSESLFQASARRVFGSQFAEPCIVTNLDFRFVVLEQLAALGITAQDILVEPVSRNTAASICAASIAIDAQFGDSLMLVSPSDHLIPDTEQFRSAVLAALPAARNGELVTFGICPDRAETGYGWLEVIDNPLTDVGTAPQRVVSFLEKPDYETAVKLFEGGKHLWNSGIFLFSTRAILEAFEMHSPDTLSKVCCAYEFSESDLGFTRLANDPWTELEDISIDFAIMERANNLTVMPYGGCWSDLGDWEAVWRESDPDDAGVVGNGPTTAIDCKNTLLHVTSENQELVAIGLVDIIAVAMKDAVLVAHKDRAQDVKAAVAKLKAKGASQAETLPRDYRPWGWYESLALGPRFQVKRIVVNPGAALSLQSHHHRSEHWIVVAGTAKVTIDDEVKLVGENQSVYIPLGAVHRMENPGKLPLTLIEVQTGSYFGEDDIIRYEDVYARGQGAKG